MRNAVLADLPDIMCMVQQTIVEMHSYNNLQWDENYPRESDFAGDIEKGDLFVAERDGHVAGFVCINRVEPMGYGGLPWSSDAPAFVIHRMVVGTAYRRQGVGAELINYAGELAHCNNVTNLKTDTYSMNVNAQRSFEKCGYRMIGTMSFRGLEKPFYCYEKFLALSPKIA